MKRALLLIGAVLLIAAGGVAGWFAGREIEGTETVTQTTTLTVTTSAEAPEASGRRRGDPRRTACSGRGR